jgi:hypothetical protein
MNLNKKEKKILIFYIRIQIYNLETFMNKQKYQEHLKLFKSILKKLES